MTARETELKLMVEPGRLIRMRDHPAVRAQRLDRPATRRQVTTYFDTPERRLREMGLALRVREMGTRRILGLKDGGDALSGAVSRREWEVDTAGAAPDPALLAQSPFASAFADPAVLAALAPIFRTEVTRTLLRLGGAGWEVELCLDEGEIKAGDRRAAIAEAEFELKRGDTARLFTLARDLLGDDGAVIGTVSKAERGYALADGRTFGPRKAAASTVTRGMSADDAFRAIARGCLGHLLTNQAPFLDNGDPEALHQMRVASRRLRSALKVFGALVPAASLGPLGDEMRWLAGLLGPARDMDVFVAEIIDPVRTALPDQPALLALRDVFERRRAGFAEQALTAVRTARFARLMLDLGAWIEGGGWHSPDQPAPLHADDFARPVLMRLHRKLRKAGRRLDTLAPAERHRVRILVKKQRYAGEFFAPLWGAKASRRYLGALARLQDVLGEMNDIEVARPHLTPSPAPADLPPLGAGLVMGWHAARAESLRATMLDAWADWVAADPFWEG
ncbi:MAG: CHAD domain-containing protein [Alphaproteobacteria bacterium]|nr:CHAD domain-containing protein [Alphaproteobacteria bacterium]